MIVVAILMGCLVPSTSFAASAPENNMKYAYYYQFADQPFVAKPVSAPMDLIRISAQAIQRTVQSLSLILWKLVSQQLPVASVPYDRKKHFGDWIVDNHNGNCLNTRGVVMVRDSLGTIGLDPNNKCFVKSGIWFDPYSNTVFRDSVDVQIDHVVPLKHVYFSGGFRWDDRLRCLYANYMGFRTHLMVVMGTENMKKGDATPYSYLPPNRAYRCDYLVNWLKIKKIWNLDLIPPETQAVVKAFKENNCDPAKFEMGLDELYQQRKFINENYHLCDNLTQRAD